MDFFSNSIRGFWHDVANIRNGYETCVLWLRIRYVYSLSEVHNHNISFILHNAEKNNNGLSEGMDVTNGKKKLNNNE